MPSIQADMPSRERLVRTLFWTLWVMTAALTLYAWGVASFGIGMFLQDAPWVPKLHMRAEVRIAETLSLVTAIGLAMITAIIGRWSRPLSRLGLVPLALWFLYLCIPRF